MPSEPIISVQQVSKAYRIWDSPAARLSTPLLAEAGRWLPAGLGRSLTQRATAGYKDFFALQQVSFELKRGEAVGIVGRNGAGKSTLLQIIAGTLQPTEGRVNVNGRVAALLELGAGFNPDFTGRENVHLSAAVLGLSRQETDTRFDAIAAFADVGEFIDQPVKTYSSGMMMRLAFAVNTCVDPDILIVDEALSVGDAPFQAKCFRRLRQLIDQGVSLLFVSHDLGTVRSICSRALWLKGGRTEMWGDAKAVAKEYEKYCWAEQGVTVATPAGEESSRPQSEARSLTPVPDPFPAIHPVPPELCQPNMEFEKAATADRWGTGLVRIKNLILVGPEGKRASTFDYDSSAAAWFLVELSADVSSDFIIGLRLNSLKGQAVLAIQDLHQTLRLEGRAGDLVAMRVQLRLPLHHTEYSLRVAIFGYKDGRLKRGLKYDFSDAVIWDVIENCGIMNIRPYADFPLSGPVHFDGETTLVKLPSR